MTTPADYDYPRRLIRPNRWLILVYIEEYFRSHHTTPTFRQIARAFGIAPEEVPAALKVESTLDYIYPEDRIRPTRWLILTYMREHFRSHGHYPRITQIARAFGIPSQNVYMHLRGTTQLMAIKVQRKERVS